MDLDFFAEKCYYITICQMEIPQSTSQLLNL